MSKDPRNIFVDQRNGYTEQPTSSGKSSSTDTKQTSNDSCATSSQTDAASTYEQRVEQMKKLAEKYQREGEGQLIKDIVNNVIEQKARGNLSNDQLVTFAKRVMPLLNNEQRTRLNELLQQLLQL